MPSSLSDDERHEYLTLVAELGALTEDISRARATARPPKVDGPFDMLGRHAPAHAPAHGRHHRLADGAEVVIRPFEPGDGRDLEAGLRRLGALSRLRRFRTPAKRMSRDEVARLTDIDHVWNEATVAFDAATGEAIGVARYMRSRDDPAQAEFACTVLDAWQHRGVGTALAEHLAARARAAGIERLVARTVVGNDPARRLMAHFADSVTEHRVGGTVEVSGVARREGGPTMTVLIAYGTSEGQAAAIAERLAGVLAEHDVGAQLVNLKESDAGDALERSEAVIVGASIHMGKHEKYVRDFVRRHREELERRPSAFYSVSLAAHADRDEAQGYVEQFAEDTGWRPEMVGLFAGALLYTQYGFITRRVMRKIARDKGSLDTDMTHDYVYTDWESVEHFAEDFLARTSAGAGT